MKMSKSIIVEGKIALYGRAEPRKVAFYTENGYACD